MLLRDVKEYKHGRVVSLRDDSNNEVVILIKRYDGLIDDVKFFISEKYSRTMITRISNPILYRALIDRYLDYIASKRINNIA